jgi:hypothetical protein
VGKFSFIVAVFSFFNIFNNGFYEGKKNPEGGFKGTGRIERHARHSKNCFVTATSGEDIMVHCCTCWDWSDDIPTRGIISVSI